MKSPSTPPSPQAKSPGSSKGAETAKAARRAPADRPPESIRDSFESILLAFILAFLFRTFEAEAFVIPTGSMAPTLYGRHKEGNCEQCGFRIVIGASDEVDDKSSALIRDHRIETARCPNCGYENADFRTKLAFNGDRILVNKFPYEFSAPHRWDVFVFKYPEHPTTNYIKRLVGLPGDVIRIRAGNLYQLNSGVEKILRKSPTKQRSLQIPVYDDAFPPKALTALGWERWAGVAQADAGDVLSDWKETDSGWKSDYEHRTYSLDGTQLSEPAWLRYRHYFPSLQEWESAERGQHIEPRARLIGDFCGYNAFTSESRSDLEVGPFWVPDLTCNFELNLDEASPQGELLVELCEGTSWYRCRIQPETGHVILEEVNPQMNGRVRELAQADSSLQGAGNYRISFANVDDRLCLWIDDQLVDFGEGALLPSAGATGFPFPTRQDLTPVGIAGQGIKCTVSKLLLERDTYYRANFPGDRMRYELENYYSRLADSLHDPRTWAEVYATHAASLGVRDIPVEEGQYVALGDNSPASRDSRLWTETSTVPQRNLVGKAFLIYWPHGVPFMNDGRGLPVRYHQDTYGHVVDDYPRFTFPFYPNFRRMHMIR